MTKRTTKRRIVVFLTCILPTIGILIYGIFSITTITGKNNFQLPFNNQRQELEITRSKINGNRVFRYESLYYFSRGSLWCEHIAKDFGNPYMRPQSTTVLKDIAVNTGIPYKRGKELSRQFSGVDMVEYNSMKVDLLCNLVQ